MQQPGPKTVPIRSAIVTLSDKGAAGLRDDASGGVIRELLVAIGASVVHYELLPDDLSTIREALARLADSGAVDLIVTTGGTGISPRDVTPEATRAVLDRELPGSPKAVRENLSVVLPAVPHLIEKLKGDPGDCART